MQDMYINEAKKTLETLSYRNKRSMKFHVFNRKFQNAVNVLDSYGRTMHNKDAVELKMFVASIKVDYRSNRQKYTEILREIATQIPTGKTPPITTAGVS